MTVALGTQWANLGTGGLAIGQALPIRSSHIANLVENESFLRSTRLRALWSLGVPVSTTNTAGFDTVYPAGSASAQMSNLSSRVLRVSIIGAQVTARVTISDTSGNSTTVSVTQSGSSSTSAESSDITAAWITDNAELMFGLEVQATTGTGTLDGVLVYEKNQTSSTLR